MPFSFVTAEIVPSIAHHIVDPKKIPNTIIDDSVVLASPILIFGKYQDVTMNPNICFHL
jgi:hypothetical protein